jgi:hypothetical protein
MNTDVYIFLLTADRCGGHRSSSRLLPG